MKRASIIATCLKNSGLSDRIEDCETVVRSVFHQSFADQDFNQWNLDVDDSTANRIIRNLGSASRINVEQFIRDLDQVLHSDLQPKLQPR